MPVSAEKAIRRLTGSFRDPFEFFAVPDTSYPVSLSSLAGVTL
jgi:hypothetical protein